MLEGKGILGFVDAISFLKEVLVVLGTCDKAA